MENIKLCPTCGKENPADRSACEHCGMPMLALLPAPTTIQVPDQPPQTVRYSPPEDVSKLLGTYTDTLVLVVVGHDQPIILKDSKQVTLGRYSPGETTPTIDLTPYRADLLGVSRQHARIVAVPGGFRVEDLGSTNGTWVNEKKLVPHQAHDLGSGSLLRLGQLGIYAYFRDGLSTASDDTLRLRNNMTNLSMGRLTAHYLSTYVTPYLSALADLQSVCNEFLERSPSEMGIKSISFDASALLQVKLDGAHEVAVLVSGKLSAWRTAQSPHIARLRRMSKDDPEAESLRRDIADAEMRLAMEFLTEVAPDSSEDQRKSYIRKVLVPLHVLTTSTLEAAPRRELSD